MNIANKTHRLNLHRSLFLFSILLGLVATALTAQADPLVTAPETWYSAGPAGTAVEGGIQFATNTATGSVSTYQSILTYFQPAALTQVGDELKVTATFSGQLGTNSRDSERPLGFAFYNSEGSQISANDLGENGGGAYNPYSGYQTRMNTTARGQSPLVFRARTSASNALLNGHTTLSGGNTGNGSRLLEDDTIYTVSYSIARTDASTLLISFSMTGGNLGENYIGSLSVASGSAGFTTTFDTFAVTVQNQNIFDTLTIHDVTISGPAIPESSTVALMLAGGVFALAMVRHHFRHRN